MASSDPSAAAEPQNPPKADYHFLVALAAEHSSASREALFHTVGEILLDAGRASSSETLGLAADILLRLLGEVEARLRWELASRLAARSDVPRELILCLATDEIKVAEPVLLNNPLLRDQDLIEIIHAQSNDHRLAVARRDGVSAEVSRVLLDTDDTALITVLLGNQGAELTPEMLDYLAEESKWQQAYQQPLIHRRDLPPELAKRIYWWVAASLRQWLCTRFDIASDTIDNEVETTVDTDLAELIARRRKPTHAQRAVQALRDRGELTTEFLLRALQIGETNLFKAGLVDLTGLRESLVARLVHDPNGTGLAVIARVLGVSPISFELMFMLTRHDGLAAARPNAVERAAITALYDGVPLDLARRVIRQWHRDPDYLRALTAVAKYQQANTNGHS